jgi:hypothetical protein
MEKLKVGDVVTRTEISPHWEIECQEKKVSPREDFVVINIEVLSFEGVQRIKVRALNSTQPLEGSWYSFNFKLKETVNLQDYFYKPNNDLTKKRK